MSAEERRVFYDTLSALRRDPRLKESDRRRFAYQTALSVRAAAMTARKPTKENL